MKFTKETFDQLTTKEFKNEKKIISTFNIFIRSLNDLNLITSIQYNSFVVELFELYVTNYTYEDFKLLFDSIIDSIDSK